MTQRSNTMTSSTSEFIPYNLLNSYGNTKRGLIEWVKEHPEAAHLPIFDANGNFKGYLIHVVSRIYTTTDDLDYVLSLGVDVNVKDCRGYTPLMIAATMDTFRKLIAAGADPNIKRDDGYDALHYYAANGKRDYLLELQKLGISSHGGTYHRTPLQLYSSYMERVYMEYEEAEEGYKGVNPLYDDDESVLAYLR